MYKRLIDLSLYLIPTFHRTLQQCTLPLINEVTLSPSQLYFFSSRSLGSLVCITLVAVCCTRKRWRHERHASTSCGRTVTCSFVTEYLVRRVQTRPCDVGCSLLLGKENLREQAVASFRIHADLHYSTYMYQKVQPARPKGTCRS
jgi:hypothetical protein